MTRVRARGEQIRQFILQHIESNPNNVSKLAMNNFQLSRQAVNSHLRRLIKDGSLLEKGNTKARTYRLAPILEWQHTYPIVDGPAEDVVWRDDVEGVIGKLPENAKHIWNYGFTEMFNNARDHSGGATIFVAIKKTAVSTEMLIA